MLSAARLPGLLPLAGVAGYPVSHSLSPVMMNAWLEASNRPGRYVGFEIAPERFESAIAAMPALSIKGFNITLPHKQTALAIAHQISDAAKAVGAANLLLRDEDGQLCADNTDVDGIRAALSEANVAPGAGKVVLLGAGGAARAALYVLKTGGWTDITIVNRSTSRAETMASEQDANAKICGWDRIDKALDGADLLINATSLGLEGKPSLPVNLDPLSPDAAVFDMVYRPLETPLLKQARESGRKPIDGLAMLIGQARPSFTAFFGAPPPDEVPIRDILLKHLEAPS